MKTTHTLGPWKLVIDSEHIDIVETVSYPATIAEVFEAKRPPIQGRPNIERSEALANARLIASAPELLEALISANKMINEHFGINDLDDGGNEVHDQIRQVISKATADGKI